MNTDSVSIMEVDNMHKHARKQEGIVELIGNKFPPGINSALQDEPRESCSFHKWGEFFFSDRLEVQLED